MTAHLEHDYQTGWFTIRVTGEATAATCICNVLNPEGVDVLVTRIMWYIKEGAHAASTAHSGFGATGADVHDFVDGLALNQADATAWLGATQTGAVEAAMTAPLGVIWADHEYYTITTAAQVSTGLDMYVFIEYIRLA
jgi:hypothetical protein